MKKQLLYISISTSLLFSYNSSHASNSASVNLTATVEQTAEIQNVNTAISAPNFAASELGNPGVIKSVTDADVKLFDNNAAGGIRIDSTSDYTTSTHGSVLQNTNDPSQQLQIIADLTPCGAGAAAKTV